MTGVDLVAAVGISASLEQTIIASQNLGGKLLRNHTLPTDNRAGRAFRQAAACVIRTKSAFRAFYSRKEAQLGPMQALVATAHKIARTIYHLLKFKTAYHDIGAEKYEQQFREREVAHLRTKAAKLGFALTGTEE